MCQIKSWRSQFLEILKREYGLPDFVHDLVFLCFIGTFRDALRGNGTAPLGNDTFILFEGGLIPYDMPTSKLTLLLLKWSLGCLGIKYENSNTHISRESVLRLLGDTYEIVFDEIAKKTAKNKEDFYERLETFYSEKHYNPEKLPDFKQAIKRYCQGISDITWKTLKPILDFVYSKGEKELVHRLIGLYLLKNTEMALKEICGIEQKDIYLIKQDVRLWANNELPPEPESESQCFLMTAGKYKPSDLSLLQRDFIDPDFYEQRKAIFQDCGSYLWGKTVVEIDKAQKLIQAIEDKCPHCAEYFSRHGQERDWLFYPVNLMIAKKTKIFKIKRLKITIRLLMKVGILQVRL
jgi:hypothetical protein